MNMNISYLKNAAKQRFLILKAQKNNHGVFSVALLQRCSSSHLGVSLLVSVSDLTRHQVCAGSVRKTVQTNYWPGFLSKENKPSRWDTLVMFWGVSYSVNQHGRVCVAPGWRNEKIIPEVNPEFCWKQLAYPESCHCNPSKAFLHICVVVFLISPSSSLVAMQVIWKSIYW